MKNIFILLIILTSLVFSAIDEYKTDVYFGNGILTSRGDAIYNTFEILEPAIRKDIYGGNEDEMYKHIGKVSYAYNDTFGFGWDILESYSQIVNTQGFKDWWVSHLLPGNKKTAHQANIKKQVDAYEASIKDGHKVLVVAHSQGNLFAQEAYETLGERSEDHDNWLQKYFEAVSIASPDATTDIKPNMPSRIGWDNDMVAIGGGSTSKKCNIRKVKWDNAHPGVQASKPKYNYVSKSDLNKLYAHKWRAVEGWLQKLDSNVHAFTFYMGQHIKDGDTGEVFLNPFTGKEMIDNTLRPVIMGQIDKQLKKLEKLPSQWKPKKEIGCVCKEKHIEVTHQFDPKEMDTLLKGQDIKNFAGEGAGKIYTVDKTYVRAQNGGESIEEVDEDEVCLRLKSSDASLGEIKGKKQGDIPKAVNGAIEMFLTWNYECDIDMNLEMTASANSRGAPYIRQDIKDIEGYGKEHTYIDSVYHTYPGDHYNFEADGEKLSDSTLEEETLAEDPIEIRALLETPTGSYFKVWEARSFGQLDLGKFAELDVKEKIMPQWICPALNNAPGWYRPYNGDTKRFQCVSCSEPYTVEWYKPNQKRPGYWKCNRPVVYSGSGGGGGRTYNQCTEKEKKKTCGCVPCEYIVSGMQKRVENGPLAGADVTIIKASELDSVSPAALWKGKTTDKEDIFKSGLLEIPTDKLQGFEDDEYYVVMAKGGNDIDYDDDMKRDISPVENNGVMHAIIKGSDLKLLPFRVNVLTEAIYQVMGEYMGSNYRQAALEENLDVIARKILSKKLYPADDEPIINYKDILLWTPAVDKRALYKPYNIYVEPIVNFVYADKERYDASYRFIYEPYSSDTPQLSPMALEIPSGLPNGTIVASLTTQNEKAFASVELEGNYADHFTVDAKGYLHINKSELIKVGNKYRLQAKAVDAEGNKGGFVSLDISVLVPSNIADPTKSVPKFVSADIQAIFENSEAGTVVAQTHFEDSNQTIVSYKLTGEDNNSFSIDDNGVISVAENATIDYEKSKLYSFKVAARNDAGNESFPVRLSVPIKNQLDTPLFDLVVFEHIEENIPLGSVVTTIRTDREGLGAIEKFEILSPHMPFTIDSNGTMYVSNYIDYEQKKQYDFYAIARTKYGNSNKIEIHIVVDDQRPEIGIPSLENLILNVDENVSAGSKIGQLVLDSGATTLERIALYGEDDNFRVDNNGSIYLADDATLDFETKTRYDLGARALNSRGWGNEVHIVINVNNIADELPTLENFRKSVEENATAGTVIGKIVSSSASEVAIDSFELTGTGNENFTIDSNGTLSVSQAAQLDYESKQHYLLQAIATSSNSFSREVEVIIDILNIPEIPPVLKPFSISMEEKIPIDTLLGSIEIVNSGDTAIDSYEMNGSSRIYIDNNGTLFSASDMNWSVDNVIHFEVRAHNGAGWSDWKTGEFTILHKNYLGDASDNTLVGSQRDEVFNGKLGNDMLKGGGGDDTYIYTFGDGNDTIVDTAGEDTLVLHQIDRATLHFEIDTNDMILVFENNQTIRISDWGENSHKIEHIKFDNNTEITLDDFNHPIATPDVAIADLSKLGNVNAAKVVQGFIKPMGNGRDKVDHWIFNYSGGELIIDTLSELNSNGSTYIDIDGDGAQLGVDIYIYLYKKDANGQWQVVASDDDSSATYGDGSSHPYDSYLKLSLGEGEYLLAIGNFSLSSANALAGSNGAGSYPGGGAYQITFNHELDFIEIPDGSNGDVYGTDHFNYYVLKNDIDPYNINGLLLFNPIIYDENATEVDSYGHVEIMGNAVSFYPDENNNSREVNVVYNIQNQNDVTCKSMLTIDVIPSLYTHVDTHINQNVWQMIQEESCFSELNVTRKR